jgi:hypothetical protein
VGNKKRKTIDYKLIMSFSPCEGWPFDRVKKAVPEEITLIKFLQNEKIPPKDKVWVALHKEFFSDKELRLLACDIAERSLTQHRVTDDRSWNAIKVSRSFANGKATKEELTFARFAAARATDAAQSAADVAQSAARATAWSVAYATRSARDATRDVAWSVATWSAVAGARSVAEYKWVCEKLIETINARETS